MPAAVQVRHPGGTVSPNRISSSGRHGSESFRLDQHARSVLRVLRCTALNCNPQIRRSGQAVQDRPLRSVGWADIPELSTCVGCCSAAWLQSRRRGAHPRPSANEAGHISSWRGSYERYALWPVAAVSGWLLLLLSPLLSAAGPGPHLRCHPGAATTPCPLQAPPPNPIAAEPDGRRVLSRGGVADHGVTPQAPWRGSGCREHSYGGFGGRPPTLPPACHFRR